jgi:hypothetical protein
MLRLMPESRILVISISATRGSCCVSSKTASYLLLSVYCTRYSKLLLVYVPASLALIAVKQMRLAVRR